MVKNRTAENLEKKGYGVEPLLAGYRLWTIVTPQKNRIG